MTNIVKKAVWFSNSDDDILDFVANSKQSFSVTIKELIRFAIELKLKNVILDHSGNVCMLTKIQDSKPIDTKKIDVSGFL